MRWLTVPFALAGLALAAGTAMAADLCFYAAGSLKAALTLPRWTRSASPSLADADYTRVSGGQRQLA
jgi:hypothetical protein